MSEVKNVQKTGCAVIGYGGMGGWHTRYILESDVAYLCGIYDINPVKVELAKTNGIRAYESLEELLADDEIKFVTIATPNEVHAEIAIKALRAGKHVITEKPVVLNSKELEEVIAVANECGRLFTVHQNRRWDIDFRMMRETYLSGKLGKVFSCESRIHGSRGVPGDWRGKPEHGGGMIYDWGVHLIDQMLQLIPEKITRVYCETTNITTSEVDDGFNLHLTFEGGKRATVEVGTYNFIAMPRFYMQTKSGSALIEDWQKKCKVAKLKAWNEKEVLPVQTAAGITKTMAPRDELTIDSYEIERPVSDVHDFYRNYVAAINGKCCQLIKNCEVRRVLLVMEAAFKSAELGQAIQVEI